MLLLLLLVQSDKAPNNKMAITTAPVKVKITKEDGASGKKLAATCGARARGAALFIF